MFQKDLSIGYLLDFYGDLLSENRRRLLEWYYFEDYSLAEISAEVGISRQGVRDAIKKAEEELRFFEEKLGLAGQYTALMEQVRTVSPLLADPALPAALREQVAELIRRAEGIRPSAGDPPAGEAAP